MLFLYSWPYLSRGVVPRMPCRRCAHTACVADSHGADPAIPASYRSRCSAQRVPKICAPRPARGQQEAQDASCTQCLRDAAPMRRCVAAEQLEFIVCIYCRAAALAVGSTRPDVRPSPFVVCNWCKAVIGSGATDPLELFACADVQRRGRQSDARRGGAPQSRHRPAVQWGRRAATSADAFPARPRGERLRVLG